MAKKKKEEPLKINLNGKDHFVDDMNEEQKMMVNHIFDTQNKMKSMSFNLDQVTIGHQAFISRLDKSLSGESDGVVEAEIVEAS